MPTYENKCESCGHTFESFQNITSDPLTDCPECKKPGTLKRLIGRGSGVIFRGTGFYQTGYKSDGKSKRLKRENGEGPKDAKDSNG